MDEVARQVEDSGWRLCRYWPGGSRIVDGLLTVSRPTIGNKTAASEGAKI